MLLSFSQPAQRRATVGGGAAFFHNELAYYCFIQE